MADIVTTTPPQELIDGLKGAMPLLNTLTEAFPEDAEDKAHGDGSADFLRKMFPHLDDLTLAAFMAYNATNFAAGWAQKEDACGHVLGLGVIFAHQAKRLAWSLATPEAPEPK